MGDLERIEATYGCVPEYFRCQYEERYEEPTEEEVTENRNRLAKYYAEIKELDGVESLYARELVEEWVKREPKNDGTAESIRAIHEWVMNRAIDITQRIAKWYDVEINDEYETFYRVPEGKFAIKVEYNDSCFFKHFYIGNLDLETFKEVFRDLYYARLRPTMSYKGMYISNSSLGELLRSYIKED